MQEWLGHSSYQVTMDVYGHLYPAAQKRIVAALDRVHDGTTETVDLAAERQARR